MHQNIHFICEISQLQIIRHRYHSYHHHPSSYCALCLVKILKLLYNSLMIVQIETEHVTKP
jgi:hypothetical protein